MARRGHTTFRYESAAAAAMLALCLMAYAVGAGTIHFRLWPYEHLQAFGNWVDGDARYVARVHPRNSIFQHSPLRAANVLVGDSLTELGLWHEYLPGVSLANRGIGGDTTLDALARVDTILQVEPRRAFVMLGTNDALKNADTHAILANYAELIDTLQAAGVEVVVQSTLECQRARCGLTLDRIRQINAALRAMARSKGAMFIDVNADLATPAEGLRAEFTYDGIHLTGAGYQRWSAAIRPFMAASAESGGQAFAHAAQTVAQASRAGP